MSNQVIIIIRFNINYDKNAFKKGFYSSLDTPKLKYRFQLFENICLPSLINLEDKQNMKVIILTSNNLHPKYYSRLQELIKPHNFIHIFHYEDNQNKDFFSVYVDKDIELVATVRLDDDDALNSKYLIKLRKYINKKNIDAIVSFPNGFAIKYFKNKWLCEKLDTQLIACGLARISSVNNLNSIYGGNHTLWKKRGFKCIFDDSPNMYVISNHRMGNDGRYNKPKNYTNLNPNIKKTFNYIKFSELRQFFKSVGE